MLQIIFSYYHSSAFNYININTHTCTDDTTTSASGGGFMGAMGSMMPDIKSDLVDMLSGVDDPPPGTDEVSY